MQSCLIRIAVFAPCTCGGGHGNAIRKWVKMKYAIIAAGEGSRLAQEGIEAPKPLVVVNGEKLIDRLLRIFTENAAEEIVVICNNLTPLVAQHLDHIQRNGLHGQRIPLRYVVKTTPSSMHSFFEISHMLNDSPFCLTTVDTIFREDDFKAYIKHFVQAVEQGTADGVMANLQRMRELQAEWKKIGAVPVTHTQEIRKAYQQYQEQFYDLVKINIELRDLDFKKNLELKTLLCEAAEKLQSNENIVEASRMLQQLHDEWAEIGPVARELREQLWERFKAASTIINKKHQAYFDELHRKEQENLARKQAIIDQLKAINEPIINGEPMNAKQWEELTQKVQSLQNEWRTIGFAPKKHNQSIYETYRAECDRFFATKKEFFLELRERRKLREQRHKEYLERQAARDELPGETPERRTDDIVELYFERQAAREQEREERRKQRTERLMAAGGNNLHKLRERLQQEIKTAENNILFFTGKSKTANKIVNDMLKKIEELKARLAEVEQQLENED